jgi:hypothetical protein
MGASRPSMSVVESRDRQFTARRSTERAFAVAPIDLVPNGVCVDNDAGAASMVSPRQDGIAEDRSARVASDNHDPRRRMRCLISATNRCPWSSTTSHERGPRNCVVPSAWTVRRAASSEPMFANRRPSLVCSLVMRVHMFTPTHGRNWYLHHVVRDLQGGLVRIARSERLAISRSRLNAGA